MIKALILGGGVIVLLFAALTACSDSLSTGADNPLTDRTDWKVSGITRVENVNPPPEWVARQVRVGLRRTNMSPGNYLETGYSAAGTGYYYFLLDGYSTGWYVVDGWFSNATTDWFGSSQDFYWNTDDKHNFDRPIDMYIVD